MAAGDHGEAFGEHGEYAHSIFVYDTTLRVPLLMSGPGVRRGARVGDPVTLADVAPTVMHMLGAPMRDAGGVDGIDLTPALGGTALPRRELLRAPDQRRRRPNINYSIDGGDNNDDTVGGLLEQFPLEAVQEFNFQTQRFKAEYGRSNGGVMSVVTKSGTNTPSGSFFESFRDKALNSESETQTLADTAAVAAGQPAPGKSEYRRNQFGGSFGGPIMKDRVHFFFAIERTQQDTTQAVNTQGLFPSLDGVYTLPYRENLGTGKMTANLNPSQFLTVRYARNNNSQPYGAGPRSTPDNWGDSANVFNSINMNHNWVLGGSKLNEFIFQYADFANNIAARTTAVNQTFPNGVSTGANTNTPQTTEQHKFQFRDDFSWHKSGGGLGHDFKAGVNFINEPRLFITFNSAKGVQQLTHVTNDVNGPINTILLNDGSSAANVPTKQLGTYIQDDWRLNDRLT